MDKPAATPVGGVGNMSPVSGYCTGKPMNESPHISVGWHHKHQGLSWVLEKLRLVEGQERYNIVEGLKEIITKKDPDFIDRICEKFPLSHHRRTWYDKDPYLWLVINSLRYADHKKINEVVRFVISR
jgi:hypothetical protein